MAENSNLSKQDEYKLSRDYASSARLNLQYYLQKQAIGFTLHPDIPVKPDMRIADVATGTGIWILDLSFQLPETVQFEGFDISAHQFPPASSLPSNIKFDTFDASATLPDHLVGKFDVVHVALVVVVVQGDKFHHWLRNLIKMLKPGGWLQWHEGDSPAFWQQMSEHPHEPEKYPGFAALAQKIAPGARQICADSRWARGLGTSFEKEGLLNVKYQINDAPARLQRAYSENELVSIGELGANMGLPGLPELISQCSDELKRGALYPGMSPIVAIGKKPE